MIYIIMCDGKGTRWNNYKNIKKHFIPINGEPLLKRTVRLFKEKDPNSKIIITSHDESYNIEGAIRYEPKHNVLEIDRFTNELIADDICFLYGDTYYPEESVEKIINEEAEDLLFFGNQKSIVAIKIKDGELFRKHVNNVKELFLKGKINECKGWHVYQSFQNLEYDKKMIANKFIVLDEDTIDFNTPIDFESRKKVEE